MRESFLTGNEILVLEDEILLRKHTAATLQNLGAIVHSAGTVAAARRLLADLTPDFALLDVHLPDGLGTDLLRENAFAPSTGVIIVTGEGRIDGAVEALQLGALDYLVKPFDPAELPLVLKRARQAKQSARIEEHRRTSDPGNRAHFFFGPSLQPLQTQLDRILAADRRLETALPPVLLEGETGTGKTSIARWIHHEGPRSKGPLVEVNCSALPDALAESELFGHERGAFTDARSARMGLFEAANGGTLFLDELPSLSPPLQAKVLTAIEDRSIRRVGSNKPVAVDIRLIAASNQNLAQAVAKGSFREDLYHRLRLFHLTIPPLRDRGPDIEELARRILQAILHRHKQPERHLSPEAVARLHTHPWPGNVRELAHELERAVVFEDGPHLHLQNLDPNLAAQSTPATEWLNPRFVFPESGFSLDDAILRLIQRALSQADGNVSGAARLLGVSRDYIRYRLQPAKEPTPNHDA